MRNWNSSKWSQGIPSSAKDAVVDNGYAPIVTDSAFAKTLTLGIDGYGEVRLVNIASTLTVPTIKLATKFFGLDTVMGQVVLRAGTLKTDSLNVGLGGTGAVYQLGGTVAGVGTSPPDVVVGGFGKGSYSLSGGTLYAKNLSIASVTFGEFTQTGGILNVDEKVLIGAGGWGKYTMSNAAIEVGGTLAVGYVNNGDFTQTGGETFVGNLIHIGGNLFNDLSERGTGKVLLNSGAKLSAGQWTFIDAQGSLRISNSTFSSPLINVLPSTASGVTSNSIELDNGIVLCNELNMDGRAFVSSGSVSPAMPSATVDSASVGSVVTVDGGTLELAGRLFIDGSYHQSSGKLIIDVDSDDPSNYGTLNVSGGVEITGSTDLIVAGINRFRGNLGDTFTIVTGQLGVISFRSVTLPPLDPRFSWQLEKTASSLTLVAVPEPSTWLLGFLAVTFSVFSRRADA